MSISVHDWPDGICFRRRVWKPEYPTARLRSLFTRAPYAQSWTRARIRAVISVDLPPAGLQDALEVFLMRLRGGAALARLTDPETHIAGRGLPAYASGPEYLFWEDDDGDDQGWEDDGGVLRAWGGTTVFVEADAEAGDTSLAMAGFDASAAAMLTGALFETGGQLYRAASAVTADSEGRATVPVAPEVLADIAEGAEVNYGLQGLFVLQSENDRALDSDGLAGFEMTFVQVFEDELGETPVSLPPDVL